MQPYYNYSPQDLAKEFSTDLKVGLSSEEAAKRLSKFGPNSLKEASGKGAILIFFSQFKSLLIAILLLAAAISFFLSETIDAIMIAAIVIMNAIVGFIQEYRVERTIEKLKKLINPQTIVFRDGQMIKIESQNLVPGDLVVLEEGQRVPADIRITSSFNLKLNEAALTGESTPVSKVTQPLTGKFIIADQKNMAFSGTTISSGKGAGIVVATGMRTEIGKIASLVAHEPEVKTPMQEKLNSLGKLIAKIVLVVAAIIGIEQLIFGQEIIKALISAIALAVAAIPEGLPAVVTISLALGTRRLLQKKSLIRNLAAAETLGSTDIICADKTGTLTEGVMSVKEIYTNGKLYQIKKNIKSPTELEKILKFGVLSSDARVRAEKAIGDPTEVALVQVALDFGIDQNALDSTHPRITEIPFSSDRKMMSAIISTEDKKIMASKGASEVILNKCTKIEISGEVRDLTDSYRQQILEMNDQMAGRALRVLAVAFRQLQSAEDLEDQEKLESNLIFLGLQGMIDPAKSGVKEAIDICQNQAGIRVVMITGDHLLTAKAIAKEVGIVGKSIAGVELDKLTDEQLQQEVEQIAVYARVNPEHKIRIIKALKTHGHQVAMTGDGVNDAAALKAADIGVAMGITGTDVAKEASDMILLDDNFTTIVEAVKEGRAIFDNIRKFVNYLLSSNIMEVLVIFFATFFGGHLPLLPIHLLWINLVTDGLPAIALGVDPPRRNIMTLPPQKFREEIAGGKFLGPLITVSVLLTIAILIIFFLYEKSPTYEQTMVFSAIVLYEMVRIFAIRSEYNLPFFSNIFLFLAISGVFLLHLVILYAPISIAGVTIQQLFKVQPLVLLDWALLLGVGFILLFAMRLLVIKPIFGFIHKEN